MTTTKNANKFVFFGTGDIAKFVLEELISAKLYPSHIVTAPDTPKGRGLNLSPSPVGILAENIAIPTLKPERLDEDTIKALKSIKGDLFVVADYGALLKKAVLDIPPRGTLNMHPSLLPRLRGPSPIRSAILTDERQTGVTIMLLDEEMDHGPIIAQRKIPVEPWPPRATILEEVLAREGGKLLAEMIPLWATGEIEARPQNHDVATYSKKFEKRDGLIHFLDDPYTNLLKIRAYEGWPTAYAFFERDGKEIRVQLLDAHVANDVLVLDVVKPEGKNAMTYTEFIRSGATPVMD
jgi:methionyl-tRNA formyltransferase